MFIPRGKPLYENLATSYVLVDALVADLCEGGFSGVVEVALSHAQSFVVVARGRLSAVVETSGARDEPLKRISLAQLARSARRERGLVSIYTYSIGVAEAVAGRLNAKPLYTDLSTEFADLEKIISKLMRERDRQWFIEVRSNIATSLVHFKDDLCRVVSAEDDVVREGDDEAALRSLLDECAKESCAFDVYFKAANEDEVVEQALEESEPVEETETIAAPEPQARDISTVVEEAKAIYNSLSLDDAASGFNNKLVEPDWLSEIAAAAEAGSQSDNGAGMEAGELPTVAHESEAANQAKPVTSDLVMAEVKRLMSDIARTVEEATRAIEQRDTFSMCLRAGQLKLAEEYPFLDPFGTEFEYLGGEIAFVGRVRPEEFIEGLTKAIKLAVEAVAQSSAQSARLRERINEDLRWLYNRHEQKFQQYGLDKTIGELINA